VDAEAWIVDQLDPMIASGEVPTEVWMLGPRSLAVSADARWSDDEGGATTRGVEIVVWIGGEAVGRFAYTVSADGALKFMDRLQPEQAARIAEAAGNDPWTPLGPARS
jgi:hypothetical protein